MKIRGHRNDDDWDDEPPLEILSGSIEVGEAYEVPQLLDHHGDPIEPTPGQIGFGVR